MNKKTRIVCDFDVPGVIEALQATLPHYSQQRDALRDSVLDKDIQRVGIEFINERISLLRDTIRMFEGIGNE